MKKLLTKSLGAILALGIVASGMTACSGGSDKSGASGGKVELTLWDQSVGETDPTAKLIPQLVEKWNNDHPNVKVTRTGTTGEQYKTKIKTALAANEAPDIFYGMGGGSFMQPYIANDKVLALDKYISDETIAKMKPGMLELCKTGGKMYTLPCYTHIASLYCNTELFDKAGAKIPTTWDELMTAVTKLKAANITPACLGEKDRWPGMYWYDMIAIRQAGHDAVIDAFKDPKKWNSTDFVAAATKMQNLAKAGAFNDSYLSMSYDEMLAYFNNGKAAMLFQANWVNAGIDTDGNATKGKVKAVTFPIFSDGKGKATEFFGGGMDGFYISAGTKSPQNAADFLSYMSEYLGTNGYLAGAGLPCWKTDGLDTSKLSALDTSAATMLNSATNFITWWDNILPADSADTHKNLIADLLAGNKTPQDFCTEMAKLKATELTL